MTLAKAMLIVQQLEGYLYSDLTEKEQKLINQAIKVIRNNSVERVL